MVSLKSISWFEKKYIGLLEEFFNRTWKDTNLPSHNLDHHRRVWRFAKELLMTVSIEQEFEHTLPEQLLIACYLHDTGMAVDPGVNHGNQSKRICSMFLAENNLPKHSFTEMLSAIEIHDNKEIDYSSSTNFVLRLLCAADDLDAFGFTGIYRYTEIYLERGIPHSEIGFRIRENAGLRFRNFLAAFGRYRELVNKHTTRYHILDDFFRDYNSEISDGNNLLTGTCKYSTLFRLFREMASGEITLKDLPSLCSDSDIDSLTKWYIIGVHSELIHP